jgi:hypothetical protein
MNDAYHFHQTPVALCRLLIAETPLVAGDTILEPFAGENHFYDSFPATNPKEWAELTRGRNYADISGSFDWVITNPPFQLDQPDGTRVNSFYHLLNYYTSENRIRKGIAFLGNDRCFATLTPLRLQSFRERGWSISRIIVCNVKRWRGRYFYIIFERAPMSFFRHIVGSF